MTQISVARVFEVQRSNQRAYFDHGWLQTYHSFSFADYYDPRNLSWGALRVLNDDTVAAGQGFPTHPHRDMEILTYVLEGELEHRDSTGNHGVVGPGAVQFMSAGTGIRHSEFNHSQTAPLHLLQMWVIPGKLGVQPSYGQTEFEPAQRRNRWLPIASGHAATQAPIRLTQDAAFFATEIDDAQALDYRFDPDRLGFLFLAEGAAAVDGLDANGEALGAQRLTTGDAIRIAGLAGLKLTGRGTLVLWDLPRIPDAAND